MPIEDTISRLFREAKERDEFEFICTLINYKGLGSKLSASNLPEWFEAIDSYVRLYSAESNPNMKVRFGLMIYSTFFESSDLYNIIGSLSRITLGYRSTPYLYFKHDKADRWYGTGEKISMVNEILIDAGFEEIENFFSNVHHKGLRNSFFHSAYSIEGDGYRLHDSGQVEIDGVLQGYASISTFIHPLILQVIDFFQGFKSAYTINYNSYTANKTVRGRFPEEIDIQIVGTENGLAGFVANGSYILLQNDFWTGMNIQFNFPTEVDRYVNEELTRLFAKENIRSNDGSLQRLYEVIVERNTLSEKQNLAIVYGRFALMLHNNANEEENYFKQTNLYKYSLTYYERMYELDPSQSLNQNYPVLMFFVGDRINDNELRKKSLRILLQCIDLDNIQENILKNTLHIVSALRERNIDISEELKEGKKIIDSISTKEYKQLIVEIKNKMEEKARTPNNM